MKKSSFINANLTLKEGSVTWVKDRHIYRGKEYIYLAYVSFGSTFHTNVEPSIYAAIGFIKKSKPWVSSWVPKENLKEVETNVVFSL